MSKPSQPMNQETSPNKQLSESSNLSSLLRNYQNNNGKHNKHHRLVENLICTITILKNGKLLQASKLIRIPQ